MVSTPAPAQAATGRRRGPYASTASRRAQIVRAALASFAEHGYERASLRDIAARAGLTHAALLRHFSGKDELLLTALAQHESDEEALAERIAQSKLPPGRILSAVLADEFAAPDYQRNWMALAVAATSPDHPAHDFFVGRSHRLRSRLTGTTLATAGGSATFSADEKVTLILAMMDGLRIQSLLDPGEQLLQPLEKFMNLITTPSAETEE